MNSTGRVIRQQRLMFPGIDAGLIVPLDHGLTVGPISGLDTLQSIKRWIGAKDFSALILHRGMLEFLSRNHLLRPNTGIVVHLNGMSGVAQDADTKRMVTTVESAIQMGADAVSIQLTFNRTNVSHNVETLGTVTTAAHSYGLPLLVMLYNRISAGEEGVEGTNKLIRMAVELGADFLKLETPGRPEHTQSIMGQFLGDTRILFAGGPMGDSAGFLGSMKYVLQQGCNGLCVGRNVFQSPRPHDLLAELARMVKEYAVDGPLTRESAVRPHSLAALDA
jgi:fructose-bisphosphate aldolase, class I